MPSIQETIVLILCLLVVFIPLANFYTALKKYWNVKVAKKSTRYTALLLLNEQYNFYSDLEDCYTFKKYFKTKPQFDRFSFDKYLAERIEEDRDDWLRIIEQAKSNQTLLAKYEKELSALPSPATKQDSKAWKIPLFVLHRIEDNLIQNSIISPVVTPTIFCKILYISPKGRNRYTDKKTYSFSEIIKYYDLVEKQIQARDTKEHQRKSMTLSMRYDILKRDKHRCVICGRSKEDGIKLHVDHIKPVSKGGKTVPENLRTLCDECNMGKKDKYDPDGIN